MLRTPWYVSIINYSRIPHVLKPHVKQPTKLSWIIYKSIWTEDYSPVSIWHFLVFCLCHEAWQCKEGNTEKADSIVARYVPKPPRVWTWRAFHTRFIQPANPWPFHQRILFSSQCNATSSLVSFRALLPLLWASHWHIGSPFILSLLSLSPLKDLLA